MKQNQTSDSGDAHTTWNHLDSLKWAQMAPNTRYCLFDLYKATGGPASQDAPDRVHTYALLRATIEFSNGIKNSVWGITCSLTYIKLSNRNGDMQW